MSTSRNRDSQRTYMWSSKVRGKDWESGVSRCKLYYIYIIYYIKILYIGWMNNKGLLYSTGNYIQYPEINHNGKNMKKNIFMYN